MGLWDLGCLDMCHESTPIPQNIKFWYNPPTEMLSKKIQVAYTVR